MPMKTRSKVRAASGPYKEWQARPTKKQKRSPVAQTVNLAGNVNVGNAFGNVGNATAAATQTTTQPTVFAPLLQVNMIVPPVSIWQPPSLSVIPTPNFLPASAYASIYAPVATPPGIIVPPFSLQPYPYVARAVYSAPTTHDDEDDDDLPPRVPPRRPTMRTYSRRNPVRQISSAFDDI